MSVRLGDLVERVRDMVPAGTPGPYLGLEHVVPDQLRRTGQGQGAGQRSSMQRVQRGDLLFGALRPVFRKLVRAPWDGLVSPEFLVLRPTGPWGVPFAWLSHPATTRAAVRLGRGTRMPRVRWSDLAELRRPAVSTRDAARIHHLAALFEERLEILHAQDRRRTRHLIGRVAAVVRPGTGPRVGEVASVRALRVPAEDLTASTPELGVADLVAGTLAVHTTRPVSGRSAKQAVRRGDLLVSRLRPALHKIALCPEDGVASPELIALDTPPELRGVLAGRLAHPRVLDHFAATATGTRMPRLPRRVVLDTRMGLEADALAGLGAELAPWADALVEDVHVARALRALRDRLLADLLDGGIRASTDAPALIG